MCRAGAGAGAGSYFGFSTPMASRAFALASSVFPAAQNFPAWVVSFRAVRVRAWSVLSVGDGVQGLMSEAALVASPRAVPVP